EVPLHRALHRVAPRWAADVDAPSREAMSVAGPDGLLLAIDGVLAVSWEPIPGAVEAMRRLREHVPFRLITNTTTHTRRDLAKTLTTAGFDVDPEEIATPGQGTAAYLR